MKVSGKFPVVAIRRRVTVGGTALQVFLIQYRPVCRQEAYILYLPEEGRKGGKEGIKRTYQNNNLFEEKPGSVKPFL